MKDLLKLIWFDAKLERFAEVFGDIIESEDIEHLLNVAPFETTLNYELSIIFDDPSKDPDNLFNVLDESNTAEIAKALKWMDKEPQDFRTEKAFFRFINDAYLWEDLEDLRRWEGELFDSLGNVEQKNFEPISDRFKGEALRSLIFFKYCHYLGGQAFDCVEIVADSLTDSDRLGYYLGGF